MLVELEERYRGGRVLTADEAEEVDEMARRTSKLDDAADRVRRSYNASGRPLMRVETTQGEVRVESPRTGQLVLVSRRGTHALSANIDPHELWAVAEMCARMAEHAEAELRENRALQATQMRQVV